MTLLLTACAATPPDADIDDTADDGKADGLARPAGVYSRSEATDGQLEELMLLADHTFLRFEGGGDWRERGTYSFTRSSTTSKRYIRFLDTDGTLIDRYTYSMNGSVLRLQRDAGSYPMFSVATGDAAWVEAIKTDWFDEAFQDWGAEAFPRTPIRRVDLPASARTIYDEVASSPGPNTVPLIYRFDLHGRQGFEMDGGSPSVRLFDATGTQVATGDGDSLFDFEWH
ncbi:MAG TPA: hypothetical protein VLB44_22535 [Kofleriaceae bacterium]|nr:hypothetical protein [Kofleriaceae bacterium]